MLAGWVKGHLYVDNMNIGRELRAVCTFKIEKQI